jgi:type I restriction enzyme S subunit
MLEGWKEVQFEELVSNTQLGTTERGATDGEDTIPLLKMGNLTWGGFDLRTTEKVAVRHINGSDLTLRPGDLLFNTRNSADLVGKSAVWRGQIAAAAFDNNINRIRLKPKADPAFYGVYLNTGLGKRRVQSLAVGSTSVAAIYWKDLKNLRVPLPPLPEQRKIAEILRAWDEALEKLSELRAAKEHQYRAFAREFFDPCHPSFHGRPNSWQEFELGDVFTERSQPGEDGERLLSVTMNGGVIDRDDVGRKDTSTEDKSRYKLVLPRDIAYNTMRMWQGVSGLSTMRGIVSPAYTIVTPRQRHILGGYAAHLFKSRRMVFDFERYSQGLTSDTWNLKFPAFSKIKLWLPPTDEQEKQANLLDAMLSEQDVLRRQIEALTRQKRGLMQKLLTGEWRVSQ